MDVTWEMPPTSPEEGPRMPGSNRRNWVYREMALLGLESLLTFQEFDASQSSARVESAVIPIRRQSSSR
jgi:hypothetical protein